MWPRIFDSGDRFRPVQTAPDLFADQFVHLNLSDVPGNGPCGARELTVHPLHPNRAMQGKTLVAIGKPIFQHVGERCFSTSHCPIVYCRVSRPSPRITPLQNSEFAVRPSWILE